MASREPGLFEARVSDVVRQAGLKLQELMQDESGGVPPLESMRAVAGGVFRDPVLFEMAPDGHLLKGQEE
jgi:hypothetical protein